MIAPPMGSLPLLTIAELEAARGRWECRQPGDAAWRLHENVERILRVPAFESPLRLRLQSNLFQTQGILLECSLAFRLSGDARYLEPIARCVLEIADEPLRRERLPGEVYPAFVLVGLAVAHELCGAAIDRKLVEATTATIVAELHDGAEEEPWGERVPKRHAWNHSAVAFAAIGCGGLLCRGVDPRAERWIETCIERLLLFFEYGITEQGMGREGLTYCGFVFRNAARLPAGGSQRRYLGLPLATSEPLHRAVAPHRALVRDRDLPRRVLPAGPQRLLLVSAPRDVRLPADLRDARSTAGRVGVRASARVRRR